MHLTIGILEIECFFLLMNSVMDPKQQRCGSENDFVSDPDPATKFQISGSEFDVKFVEKILKL